MEIHIGKIIFKRLEELGMSKTELGRKINTSHSNIYKIFEKKSIDTDMLIRISDALEYNFFRHYITDSKPNEALIQIDDIEKYKAENESLRSKYIDVLEKYNALLAHNK